MTYKHENTTVSQYMSAIQETRYHAVHQSK